MDYVLITNADALRPHEEALLAARILAVDVETTGLDPHADTLRLVQLAIADHPVLILDCQTFLPDGLPLLQSILQTKAVKIFQNAKFDLQFLMNLHIYPKPIFDTMLAARLLYMPGMPRRANLATLSEYYLGETLDKSEQTSDWRAALTPAQLAYAARDAAVLLRLREVMVPMLRNQDLSAIAAIEFHCVRAIAMMEYHGLNLDQAQWSAFTHHTEQAREAALEALYEFTGRPMAQMTLWGEEESLGLNLDSNQVVLKLLHDHGIAVDTTSKASLYPYRDHPLVKALTAYRKASKSLSTFLHTMTAFIHPATGRVHPQYGQISVYSGRMSCGNPNIQQVPRDKAFRRCFAAPPGRRLVIADYSQIELRVAAQISRDRQMTAAYQRGDDLHLLTASLVTGVPMEAVTAASRQAAKAVNFGLIYGMGAQGLSQYAQQSYGVEMSLSQATTFVDRFFLAYPGIAAWHQRLKTSPPTEGRTLTGRRFAISESPSLPELSNAPVQGTAADITKKALGMLASHLLGTDTWIIGVVHDEILLEAPEAQADEMAALLADTMRAAAEFILPDIPADVEAKVSASWAEK